MTLTTVRNLTGAALGLTALTVSSAAAQSLVSVRTSALYENYTFGAGLVYQGINQFTTPVAITADFGGLGRLAISTGYTTVKLNGRSQQLPDQTLSGTVDTDLRWTFEVVPGRLYLLANGAIPTGIKGVQSDELSIFGALSSDIIGFAAPNIGTGGNVGGGFVAAVPIGSWALGVGSTFRAPMTYSPVSGDPTLRPGAELRIRTGLEGAIGRRTYLRFAGIFANRRKDQRGGSMRNGVGNRFIGYAAVNQGVGNVTVTAYAFDIFRMDPQVEPTATGAALLERGNLLSLGLQAAYPFSPDLSFTPRFEYRLSHQANSLTDTQLRWRGRSLRFGGSVRHRVSRHFGIVARGSYLTGKVLQADANVPFTGYRAELHLEWIP